MKFLKNCRDLRRTCCNVRLALVFLLAVIISMAAGGGEKLTRLKIYGY